MQHSKPPRFYGKMHGSHQTGRKTYLYVPLLLACVWFLVRVFPKPTRALYPCQQGAFVVLGLHGKLLIEGLALHMGVLLRRVGPSLAVGVLGTFALFCGRGDLGGLQTHGPLGTESGEATVVGVHNSVATDWDFSSGYYGDDVDQAVVTRMVEVGVKTLTGAETVEDAWNAVMESYELGDQVAIKVNMNNTDVYYPGRNNIDALIQPVNALIEGLLSIGVPADDIWVYDAVRILPVRFTEACPYPVRFYDSEGRYGNHKATFNNNDPDGLVDFSAPGLESKRLTDVVVEAEHLINMPILKEHVTGVTGAMKNHYGSVPDVWTLH